MAVAIIVPGRPGGASYQVRGLTAAGGGGYTLVSSVGSTGGFTATVNTTAAIDTSGANLLIAYVNQYDGYTIGSVSDSKGNTWVGLTSKDDTSDYSRLYYCASPTVGSGHTFTFGSGSNGNPMIAVQAWSGANVTPFDVQNGATANAGTIQPGSVTPSQANSLIVTGFSAGGGTGYSVSGGYTTTCNDDVGAHGNQGMALAYSVQTAAAATNPTWTNAGGINLLTAVIAVFKP